MTPFTASVLTRLRLATALLFASGPFAPMTAGAYFAGGGKKPENDCLIGYQVDADAVVQDGKKYLVECTDCDPACDLDGVTTANGSCTFEVGVCTNQGGVEGCTPASGLDKAKAKVKGAKVVVDVAQLLEGSVCGALLDLPVTTKKNGKKPGKATLSLNASVKPETGKKLTDKDKLTYVCNPRPEGEACPSPTTTTTLPPVPTVFSFRTGAPVGDCGTVRTGGSGGTELKPLGCGGLNVGGGNSTVAEGPTPDNAETQMNVDCSGTTCTASGRTSAETGDATNCSDVGCPFGPYLPISNSGASTCVRNTFSTAASGTLDLASGEFTGAFPLTSTVYLTANATLPCPLCVNGTPGVAGSGTCQDANQWTSGAGPTPDAGAACTPVNATGDSHDCDPPAAVQLTPFAVNLDPITTGTAFKDGPSFCPSQATPGAFGCNGTTTALCANGALGVADYVAEVGTPAGDLSGGSGSATLASVFCIPDAGNFVINAAANLPGPGATSLPGTFTLLP
jgi:hypothetical protein